MAQAKVTGTGQAVVSGLAGRYATALFDLARDSNALPAVDASLARFADALQANPDLASLTTSPGIARTQAAAAIGAVAATLELDGLSARFLGVLAANRRLAAFGAVRAAFAQLMAGHRGEVSADVTSAHALSDAQLVALKAKLRAGLGRDVAIHTRLDPAILGGLIVRVGSKLIDSSLKTKLDTLAIAMKG